MREGAKKMYFWVLTLITTVFIIGLAVLKVNEVSGNALFSLPAETQKIVDFIVDYGAMILLCMFAFGGLAGRLIKFIVLFFIIAAIIIFIIAAIAPDLIAGIFMVQLVL